MSGCDFPRLMREKGVKFLQVPELGIGMRHPNEPCRITTTGEKFLLLQLYKVLTPEPACSLQHMYSVTTDNHIPCPHLHTDTQQQAHHNGNVAPPRHWQWAVLPHEELSGQVKLPKKRRVPRYDSVQMRHSAPTTKSRMKNEDNNS